MLVLTQRDGEDVTIRDPAGSLIGRVILVRASGGRARIGFEFPRSYAVDRQQNDRKKHVNRDGSPWAA